MSPAPDVLNSLLKGRVSTEAREASLLQKVLLLSFSLAYGFVLQWLPVLQFKDRENYLRYAENSAEILSNFASEGVLAVFANEPLWLLINSMLALIAGPESVVRIIIFVSGTLFSYVLTRANPENALWLIVFLFVPQILKNFITHLRQGLGMAIFFAGYFSVRPARRWVLMMAAPFIHASFFFILPFVMLPEVLRSMQLDVDGRLLAMAAFSIVASLSLGLVAAMIGARQFAQYDFAMTEVSGLGFAYWLVFCAVIFLQGKSFLERHQEAAGVLLFYLLSYFFIEVTARIFESGMPLVLLAGLALKGLWRWVFISSFLSYSVLQWFMRLASDTPF